LHRCAFTDAWNNRETGEMDGLQLNFLGRADYVRNQRALGRAHGLADINRLTSE
jgi:hypothetical protein